jgi:hypothetical protein
MVKGWVWFGECRHGRSHSHKTSRTCTRTHKHTSKHCR